MLKEILVDNFITMKEDNSLSYKDMVRSGLSESQIANILKHGGRKVSIEVIESSFKYFGFGIRPVFYKLKDGTDLETKNED